MKKRIPVPIDTISLVFIDPHSHKKLYRKTFDAYSFNHEKNGVKNFVNPHMSFFLSAKTKEGKQLYPHSVECKNGKLFALYA